MNDPSVFTRGTPEKDRTLSFRAPESFVAEVVEFARLVGLNQSDYVRRAVAELNDRLMDERIKRLSQQLSPQSPLAAESMEGASSDGLEAW